MNNKIKHLLDGGIISKDDIDMYIKRNPDEYRIVDTLTNAIHHFPMHSIIPVNIVASVSRVFQETLIFEGDSDGKIVSPHPYGGISVRISPDINWCDSDLAVKKVFGDVLFERVGDYIVHETGLFMHYRRALTNSATSWINFETITNR